MPESASQELANRWWCLGLVLRMRRYPTQCAAGAPGLLATMAAPGWPRWRESSHERELPMTTDPVLIRLRRKLGFVPPAVLR